MAGTAPDDLNRARRDAALSVAELWPRRFDQPRTAGQ